MKTSTTATKWTLSLLLICLLATAAWAAKKKVDPSRYQGVSEEEAFEYLIDLAKEAAENGSWENIRIAEVYMLAGRHDEGQAIIDGIPGKREATDYLRMGRAYYRAGDWAQAQKAFDQALSMRPKDADWLAEIGAYYNVEGNREKAEELFARSFDEAPRDDDNLRFAAGSYLGVVPRP